MINYILIIPARLNSTRFPAKLLKKIYKYEVLKHTWLRCCRATSKKNIYVATADKKIIDFCRAEKINYILTGKSCLTGTDRIIEIAKKVNKDFYINVQGDEILVDPKSIQKVINTCKKFKNRFVINAYTNIRSKKEYKNLNVPKVVFSQSGNLIYISRSGIPSSKLGNLQKSYKQVCIYAYPRNILLKIKKNKKALLEKIEDIEILRFLESGFIIKMIKARGSRLSIDTPNDLIAAKKLLKY